MSLPDAWIERIFDKLTLVYGHQFLSRWDGLSLEKVKANWAAELSRFQQNPNALGYALENLPPGKAPTVLEFRALCNSPQAPRPEAVQMLPSYSGPTADDLAWQRHLPRLQKVRAEKPETAGRCDWAYALRLKDLDPDEPRKLTPGIRAMYREVIANHERLRTARPIRTNGLPEPTTGE
jgi:hypothetical protein